MDPSAFRKLVEQAKADPEFFHNLVFAPDKALSSAKYLDKRAKQALQTINPESVVALAVGELQGCGGDYTCSCTSGTCGDTCGGSTCSVTCSGDSCGSTCGDSCGYTSNIEREDVLNPELYSGDYYYNFF